MYRHWSPAAIKKLRRLYPNMENGEIGKRLRRTWSAVQNKAVKLGLRKSAKFLASETCRFQKGQPAWNRGLHYQPGGRNKRTRFKPGNRPQTWLPIGTERTNRDGTIERKVSDTRNKRDWKPVKDMVWEAANGPIQRGRFVVHKNRDRQDFRLSNLELVDRAENMRRNTYHRYPKEIARLIQLRGALNRQINKREARHEPQHRRPA